ncbi:N-acetylmuramoyl-L-alanine amidase [Leisingera sp. NJS204]|uniref:N-acetylmuramoyl-L-alanine amidase n=1 Tax=Leisingera sp. NJS204 TaxID=2508307 RepID=UPI0010110B03|nr:N-acetylmuramoyl-L-alanine amidase [Leisingera sp. NJS204]QAX29285.1 N-acetylmuramoyl-L-alanine amidase [Leisingera sp. NJS204]
MGIQYGRVTGIDFNEARWIGHEITPSLVILHDTASRIEKGNAARYLQDNGAKVSVQFVIERDGHIEQQVPVNRKASHAGKSEYHGREWCNGFSIGIEMVNPGRMTRASEQSARTWFGQKFSILEYGIEEAETPHHGHGLWMPYTEEQIAALVGLLQTLFSSIPTLEDMTTHWYVSPGRKVDTNPLFPLEHIRSLILGRTDPAEAELGDEEIPAAADDFVIISTPGDTLNMRRWPSFNPNVIAQIPDETRVPVIASVTVAGRDWLKVIYGGAEGWIAESYADPVTISKPGFKGAET